MFLIRRFLWFVTGATAGFGGAMWIRRQVIRKVEQLVPERVSTAASDSARRFGRDLREAVAEGRTTARGRAAELRAELRPGPGTEPGPGPASTAGPGSRAGPPAVIDQGRSSSSPVG